MSYEEVAAKLPDEFEARAKDKLRYRYPRGESYEDLIRRLDPVIIELERQRKPILIVAHRAVLRCLYAYFADENDRDHVPHVVIPLHTVICLQPHAYGTGIERFKLMEGKD
jgi:6-phosphofructo-2-kinase / fructose-2,6-biphosphatase 3